MADAKTSYPDVGAWQQAAEGQTQNAKTAYPDVGAWQNQPSAGGGFLVDDDALLYQIVEYW